MNPAPMRIDRVCYTWRSRRLGDHLHACVVKIMIIEAAWYLRASLGFRVVPADVVTRPTVLVWNCAGLRCARQSLLVVTSTTDVAWHGLASLGLYAVPRERLVLTLAIVMGRDTVPVALRMGRV